MHRLLIVTERFWPEEFIINDLAADLASRGLEVTVFTQQPSYPRGRCYKGRTNRLFSRETWRGVRIVRFKTVLGYRESLFFKLLNYAWFLAVGSFLAPLALPRADRVLVYQTGPLTLAVPGIAAARVQRIPLVIWTQDVWPDSVYAYGFRKTGLLRSFLGAFVRWVYRSSDAVLISCEGFRRILGRYSGKPMTFAPNWPLAPYVPGRETVRKGRAPLFVFAGNVGKVQNLDNVVRGFALALRSRAGFARLRVVGDGSHLDALKDLSRAEGIPVEFTGRKRPEDMGPEYDSADFLVLSLANQGVFRLTVPSKFQMYLSVGKPILCAAGGEVAEMVQAYDLGISCDPDSPEDIARAFLCMSSVDSAQKERWARTARETLGTRYDRSRVVETIRGALISSGAGRT
jgi:glycosyltransferase involved in cell wall biosynthesis